MKALSGYNDLPPAIREQIGKVTQIWIKHMADALVGVYLHGSIALNAFHPESGDIDILIVVKDSVSAGKRLSIAKDIIAIDQKPRPLEMSAIKLADAMRWKNPGNCVFHYSDYWTQRYLARFADPEAALPVVDREFPDPDVTGYIRLIKQCGIVLYGQHPDEVFADIPDEDFWAAISADIDDYRFDHYEARYFASNILILGRILSFKVEKRILSKYDAGKWMIDYVPEALKHVPQKAMKVWFEGEACDFEEESLEKLRAFLVDEIKR